MHGLEVDWAGDVRFVFLDIDDSKVEEFKRQLGYRYQPHLFLLDGKGQVLQQWVGYVEREILDEAIRAFVESS